MGYKDKHILEKIVSTYRCTDIDIAVLFKFDWARVLK